MSKSSFPKGFTLCLLPLLGYAIYAAPGPGFTRSSPGDPPPSHVFSNGQKLDIISPPSLPEMTEMFEAVNDSTYTLGPGDVLFIGVGPNGTYSVVNPDGQLIIDPMKPLPVFGMPLHEAKKSIVEKLSSDYRSGKIHVSLAKAKKFMVSITGMVHNPGLYSVDAGARVSHLVSLAGGFSSEAERKVRIRPRFGEERKIDLHEFFYSGDLKENPYLSQGDQVFVPGIDHNAQIVYIREDKFFRPVRLRENDNLEGLIFRYDNFKNVREWSFINVYKDQELIASVERRKASEYTPVPGVVLEVHSPKSMVYVSGDVARPGPVEYNPNMTPLDYVAQAGILPTTARMTKVSIVDREGRSRKVDASKGIVHNGDHIHVRRSVEASARDYISLMVSIASLGVALATFIVLAP